MQNKINYLNQKDEYIFVDFVKFICALLVVTIHIPMFTDINKDFCYFETQILARLAVPFFFLCSGFFIGNKLKDKTKFIFYCKRLLILYVIYTILYIPLIIAKWNMSDNNLLQILKKLFLVGSFNQLWYFLAIIVASLILHFLVVKVKLSDIKLLVISSILYILGVLLCSYGDLLYELPIIKYVVYVYLCVFSTARNGIFFGLFFVVIGYLINKHGDIIKNRLKLYSILSILFFGLMSLESYLLLEYLNKNSLDMTFTASFATVFLFLFVIFVKIPKQHFKYGIILRKLSILIFGFHKMIDFYIEKFIKKHLDFNSLEYGIMIIIITIAFSSCILLLEKNSKFKFLRYLH